MSKNATARIPATNKKYKAWNVVIEADQTERDGKTTRNDRLIAVPCDSQEHRKVCALKDLNPTVIQEVEHFFVSYNEQRGKKFKVLGKHGPSRAEKIAKEGMKAHA